jgi:hypothetical protein
MELNKIIVLVFYFICIYIYLHTYFYLEQINNCPCFHKDGKYKVNLDFMKFFQVLEIFMLSVLVLSAFFFTSKIYKSKNKPLPKFLLSILLLFLLSVNGYMSYNVVNLYNNIKDDCECVDSWYRFFLYYEGIVSGLTVFRFISMALVAAIFFFTRKFK